MAYGLLLNQSSFTLVPSTIRVYYYIPDYVDLIQEFWWQTLDHPPNYPRIHKFLDFWKLNIEAVIKEIEISSNETITYRKADILLNFKNNYC